MTPETDLQTFLRSFSTVPPSQRVLLRLLGLLSDEHADLEDVAAAARIDPGIAAAVIRLANSAYFGLGSPVESIDEAVSLLGTTELVKVVAIVALQDMAADTSRWLGITSDDSWRVSVAAALAMEHWSPRTGLDPAPAYTVGLLHAIGRWMIARWIGETGREASPPDGSYLELAEWERATFGVSYAEVSCLMLERWSFPDSLSTPICFQLNPFDAPSHVRTACVLRCVLPLAGLIVLPERNSKAALGEADKALEVAGMTAGELLESVSALRQEMERLTDMLG